MVPRRGPAFVPTGIHKPAYFITLSSDSPGGSNASSPALVSETSIDISKQGYEVATQDPANETAPWVVEVKLGVHSIVDTNASLVLSIPELGLTSDTLSLGPIPSLNDSVVSTPFFVAANWTIDDSIPERWWPHNLGTPKLYNLSITLNVNDVPLTFNSTVGFRTIRLAQTRYPDEEVAARGITPGDQWHFEVNGAAFYASGTNIIPFDPFYARVTDEQVRWVVESAVQGGQNMVRVPVKHPSISICIRSWHPCTIAEGLGRRCISTELDQLRHHARLPAARYRHLLVLRLLR